jgi:prevent-host-death family protein
MDVSVTRFREHCLELLSQVESSGEEVEITRDGKPVARLTPAVPRQAGKQRPWETLRGSGVLMVDPDESMLDSSAFDAMR